MSDLGFTEGLIVGPALAQAARRRGEVGKVFDWDKAARLIAESRPVRAEAGLARDWPSTGGEIWRDGKPVPQDETYTYLASAWATPQLILDYGDQEDTVDCWVPETDTEWGADTYWPESALALVQR